MLVYKNLNLYSNCKICIKSFKSKVSYWFFADDIVETYNNDIWEEFGKK